ncbi:MAG: hypothetical protein ACOYJS_04695 [Acutalibacteraceae bacterium]|jgi:hypothetical protein
MSTEIETKQKRLFIIIVSALVVMAIVAAAFLLKGASKINANDLLVNAKWTRLNKETLEKIRIVFHENGDYYYHCDCGEPIDDSDIYNKYEYDTTKREITLTGQNSKKDTVKVVYCDEYYLALKFSNDLAIFKNEKSNIYDVLSKSSIEVGDLPVMYVTILSYENGKLTVAPYDYDGDAHKSFVDCIYTIDVANDAIFESYSFTYENGKEKYEDYKQLGKDDYKNIGNYYTVGYVELDKEGKVSAVTFYGKTEVFTK